MFVDWLSEVLAGTPLMNETFLEVWGWIQFAIDAFIVFNVFRFSFHVLRGATEEFLLKSRLAQFAIRHWKPLLAGHLIYCTLRGAYGTWFYVILLVVALVLVTIMIILQFLIERLEKQNQAYRDMLEKDNKDNKEDTDADADEDEGDEEGDGDKSG